MSFKQMPAWLVLPAILFCAPGMRAQVPNKVEIEKTIREYLLEHPEILLEMSQTLQKRQTASKRDQAQSKLAAHRNELVADAKEGEGIVTVVEFFDYRCGYCKKVNPVMEKMMVNNPNVRVLYKQYPILGEDSIRAAQAALAAAKQGGYLKFHNALLESQDLSLAAIEKIAAAQGLDVARLAKDMASDEVKSDIARTSELATALNIEATPSFVIGNEVVPGAIDDDGFKRLIAKAKAASSETDRMTGGN